MHKLTWMICRGFTESVGKFPRPWMGTLSPRMESKRRTWSQDRTLSRRLCSGASPDDMTTGGRWTLLRGTSTPLARWDGGGRVKTTAARASLPFTERSRTASVFWKVYSKASGHLPEAAAALRDRLPSPSPLRRLKILGTRDRVFSHPAGITTRLPIGWTQIYEGSDAHKGRHRFNTPTSGVRRRFCHRRKFESAPQDLKKIFCDMVS